MWVSARQRYSALGPKTHHAACSLHTGQRKDSVLHFSQLGRKRQAGGKPARRKATEQWDKPDQCDRGKQKANGFRKGIAIRKALLAFIKAGVPASVQEISPGHWNHSKTQGNFLCVGVEGWRWMLRPRTQPCLVVWPPTKLSQALHHRSSWCSGRHQAPPHVGSQHPRPCSLL